MATISLPGVCLMAPECNTTAYDSFYWVVYGFWYKALTTCYTHFWWIEMHLLILTSIQYLMLKHISCLLCHYNNLCINTADSTNLNQALAEVSLIITSLYSWHSPPPINLFAKTFLRPWLWIQTIFFFKILSTVFILKI